MKAFHLLENSERLSQPIDILCDGVSVKSRRKSAMAFGLSNGETLFNNILGQAHAFYRLV